MRNFRSMRGILAAPGANESLADEDEDEDEIQLQPFSDAQMIRLFISPTQARIFHDRAELVIAAGRQPCPFCGLPINPEGHLCARANGYRR